MPTLCSYFNEEDDPRKSNAPRHKFCDLMTISLLCALCGGGDGGRHGAFWADEGGISS